MEEFINALIDFDNEMRKSIIYKIDNNIKLDEADLLYLEYLKREKKRREKNVRK